MTLYRNPDNGGVVASFHYTADPAKRGNWADLESRIYPGGRDSIEWRQEYEIDFEAEERTRTYWAFEPRRNVIAPFPIPLEWSWFLCVDFGQTAPTAWLFMAQNPWTQAVFIFDELYVPNAKPKAVSAEIYERLGRHAGVGINAMNLGEILDDCVGDPMGPAFAQHYGEEPHPIWIRTKGFNTPWKLNDRRQGAARVNEAFSPSFICCGKRQYPVGGGAQGRCNTCNEARQAFPLLYIFEGRCPNLVRTIPKCTKIPAANEALEETERDEKVEDHAPDAMRYGIMRTMFEIPAHQQKADLLNTANALLTDTEALQKVRLHAIHENQMRRLVDEDDDETITVGSISLEEDFGPYEIEQEFFYGLDSSLVA